MSERKVYKGPPPASLFREFTGEYFWTCECGATSTSPSVERAQSDVNRHRQAQPEKHGKMVS